MILTRTLCVLAVIAACSSGSSADGDGPAEVVLPPAPLAARPAPIEVATPRPPLGPVPPLAEVIAEARKELGGGGEAGQTVTLYDIAVEHDGPIETGDVFLKFQRSLDNGFRRCYQSTLRGDARIAGRVHLRMRVGAGGKLERVEAARTFDDALGECLCRRAEGWKFGVMADDVGAVMTLVVGFEP